LARARRWRISLKPQAWLKIVAEILSYWSISRGNTIKDWFLPPIVIPAALVLAFLGYGLFPARFDVA
jgi:hypothetical protein